MENMESISEQDKIKYYGYKGINLDKLGINQLKNLKQILYFNYKKENYEETTAKLAELETLSLDEVKRLAAEILSKYFTLNDIYTISMEELKENRDTITCAWNATEVYDNVNSILVKKSPLDLEIRLEEGNSLFGEIVKPTIIVPGHFTEPNRKVYFSNINLGNQLTTVSAGTLAHEVAHALQEQNIGYCEDYLNKEIISIFLEKVVAYELDPSNKTLWISERLRNFDTYTKFVNLAFKPDGLSTSEKIDNLLYVKSTLFAQKLFDMYLQEKKQKYRDRYFSDIQKVFDGKQTVEELIAKRKITINNSQDISLLRRHF